ncbi:MAG: DUF2029 domain-containing protein [bacterium]|nr:DUF2029 domain-containing protein [bacterium]
MDNHLVPTLVLLVFPALYLGYRLGLFESARGRWIGGGALLAAVALSLPYEGVDFLIIKRLNLLIAAAVGTILVLRHLGVVRTRKRGRYLGTLAIVGAFSVVAYCNFFSFHGARTFVHLHDVVHYYLGSKYYAELGYSDLYTAMLRAEAELYDNHFKTIEARDLATYERVHIRELLVRSEPVKAAFTPPRWGEFKRDVAWFRGALDQHWGGVLIDHGFNPTPVWALVGGTLSRLVPPGSRRGILVLCLLDVALLAAVCAAVGWAFGRLALALSLIHFCVIFGTNFGWTGGAFLRYLWFFGVVVGICCLRRRHHAAAGALVALAAMLRIFPVLFVVPIACKAVAVSWRRRRVPRRYVAFLGSFAVTAGVLLALTGLLPRGWRHWEEFRDNMERHVENISPNVVGLTEILSHGGGPEKVTQEEFNALKARRQRIYTAQLILVFVPVLLVVARLSRWQTDVGAALLALPLLVVGLSLASYYYVFLILLVLVYRNRPQTLALIFAIEVAAYGLMLFEEREGLLYVYRSVLILWLYLALWLEPVRRELRRMTAAS